MSYRKIWLDGVRAFVVREPTPERPLAVLVCRTSLLPIGIAGRPLERGWIMFDVWIGSGKSAGGELGDDQIRPAGVDVELDDLAG